MIRIGNKVVAGSADVDLSTVLKALNKTGLSVWVGTQTEHDALSDTVKNNEKTTFITYDTDEDVYLIIDTIVSYGKTWSSVKISSELAKKINAADVYTKEQVDEIINAKLASALKYKGAVNTTALLPASAENGDTYFVKADGFIYAYNLAETKWDALGTVADMTNYFTKAEITAMLQDKADKFQYDVLPTPSSETVGLLLQYTGADTQDYKNGYFYKGIDNGDDTYDWELAKTGDYYSKSETAIKYNYTMTGTASIEDDIKTFVTALIALGANTYVGFFNRSGSLGTAGNYSITVYAEEGTSAFASGYIVFGAGALGKTQYTVSYYKPIGSSEEWTINKLVTESENNFKYQVLTADSDLNNVVASGAYSIYISDATSQATNHAPVDGWLQLSVFQMDNSDAYCNQILYRTGDEMFMRECSNHVWSDWKKFATTDSILSRSSSLGVVIDNSSLTIDGSNDFANNVGRINGKDSFCNISNPLTGRQWPITNSETNNHYFSVGSSFDFFTDYSTGKVYMRTATTDYNSWFELKPTDTVTSGSTAPITSGGVYSMLNGIEAANYRVVIPVPFNYAVTRYVITIYTTNGYICYDAYIRKDPVLANTYLMTTKEIEFSGTKPTPTFSIALSGNNLEVIVENVSNISNYSISK